MPKEIVITGLMNRIVYATTNGKGLITGKREDITDRCIDVVYHHLKTEFDRSNDNNENSDKARFGYKYPDGGQLLYIPPDSEEKTEEVTK